MPASFDFEEISDEFFSVFRCVLALISIFSGTWFADGLVGCRASRIEFGREIRKINSEEEIGR